MEAELFIHGPRHAFYGKQEEVLYCQLFDNSKIKDEIRFVVEIRKREDGKRYAYYTYCRYSNVLDVDGRNGAYIGLTIRLDAYYANLRNLYTTIEAVFYAKVIGLLIKKVGNHYQYLVGDFQNSRQSILNNVEKRLGTLLAGIISQDDVLPIDSSFTTGGTEVIHGLDDNQYSASRMAELKRSGRLVFASTIDIDIVLKLKKEFAAAEQTFKAEQYKENIQMQKRLEDANRVSTALGKELSEKNDFIKSLQAEEAKLKDSLNSLEEEKRELVAKLDRFHEIGDTPQQINTQKGHSQVKNKKPLKIALHRIILLSRKKLNNKKLTLIISSSCICIILIAIVSPICFSEKKDNARQHEYSQTMTMLNHNALSDRIYPEYAESPVDDLLKISEPDKDHFFKLRVKAPASRSSVDKYDWIIKDSRSKTIYKTTTDNRQLKFDLESPDTYTIQLFIKDTLILTQQFNYSHEYENSK